MNRRAFIAAIAGSMFSAPLTGAPQQPAKVFRIGILGTYPPTTPEVAHRHFDAVIACGMGPVELKTTRDPNRNPVPANVFNFFNAVATKILVSRGWAGEGILSGTQSRKTAREGVRPDVALEELAQSEGSILEHIFRQTRPKNTQKQPVMSVILSIKHFQLLTSWVLTLIPILVRFLMLLGNLYARRLTLPQTATIRLHLKLRHFLLICMRNLCCLTGETRRTAANSTR